SSPPLPTSRHPSAQPQRARSRGRCVGGAVRLSLRLPPDHRQPSCHWHDRQRDTRDERSPAHPSRYSPDQLRRREDRRAHELGIAGKDGPLRFPDDSSPKGRGTVSGSRQSSSASTRESTAPERRTTVWKTVTSAARSARFRLSLTDGSSSAAVHQVPRPRSTVSRLVLV